MAATDVPAKVQAFIFEPLLNGLEGPQCVDVRERLFKSSWAETEESIQAGLALPDNGSADVYGSRSWDDRTTGHL